MWFSIAILNFQFFFVGVSSVWIESDMLAIDTDCKLPNNFRDEILRTIQQRFQIFKPWLPSGKHTKNYEQPPFLMDTSTNSMAIFKFANCLFLSCTVDMERNPLILSIDSITKQRKNYIPLVDYTSIILPLIFHSRFLPILHDEVKIPSSHLIILVDS